MTGGSGVGEATDQLPFSGPLESAPVRAGGPFSGPQCASCPASLAPGDGHRACFRVFVCASQSAAAVNNIALLSSALVSLSAGREAYGPEEAASRPGPISCGWTIWAPVLGDSSGGLLANGWTPCDTSSGCSSCPVQCHQTWNIGETPPPFSGAFPSAE
ncbi:unnamed protein product [Boreogadus saida]